MAVKEQADAIAGVPKKEKKKDAYGLDPSAPWNTPMSDTPAPKKYTEAEIEENIKRKPKPPLSASEVAGEPKRENFSSSGAYNIAMRRWVQKETAK